MDIDKLFTKDKADAGRWLELKDINGKPTGIRFRVAGSHSERFRRAMAKARADQLNRMKAVGQRDLTADDVEIEFDLMSEALAAITLEWEEITHNGEPLELTPQNARMIYENAPDVRRQVFEYCNNARNYFLSQSSESA